MPPFVSRSDTFGAVKSLLALFSSQTKTVRDKLGVVSSKYRGTKDQQSNEVNADGPESLQLQ